MKKLLLIAGLLALTACNSQSEQTETLKPSKASESKVVAEVPKNTRLYSAEQIAEGKTVFEHHCQICHGKNAVGETMEWQIAREDGTFPAPPLDGSAHAWHHSSSVLLGTINRGGIVLGGRMPAFKDALSDEQKISVLAFIQSLWPEEVFQIWLKNNG